jgi:hypothetical protein
MSERNTSTPEARAILEESIAAHPLSEIEAWTWGKMAAGVLPAFSRTVCEACGGWSSRERYRAYCAYVALLDTLHYPLWGQVRVAFRERMEAQPSTNI